MSARNWLLPFLAVLWLWPVVAHGQSPAFMDANKRAADLYDQGRYQEALPFAEKALRLGEREFGPDHPTTATLLNNLAALYDTQDRYAEAEPLIKRALAILEQALGPDHPEFAQSLEDYAALLHKTGRSNEAAKMEARAKAIRAKPGGKEGFDKGPSAQGGLWKTYTAAAAKAFRQGNYQESEKQLAAAVMVAEGFGPQDPRLVKSLESLSLLYLHWVRYADAEPLIKRVLAIREKTLGLEHPDVAQSLTTYAVVLGNTGRSAEAIKMMARAKAIRAKHAR